MNMTTLPSNAVIITPDGKPVTTSQTIADVFGRRHDHVLRDIEDLEAECDALDAEFDNLNFKGVSKSGDNSIHPNFGGNEKHQCFRGQPVYGDSGNRQLELLDRPAQPARPVLFERATYRDSIGRTLPLYRITRDGFMLLVMGFTGTRALRFKLAFIQRFNDLERNAAAAPAQYVEPGTPSIEERIRMLERKLYSITAPTVPGIPESAPIPTAPAVLRPTFHEKTTPKRAYYEIPETHSVLRALTPRDMLHLRTFIVKYNGFRISRIMFRSRCAGLSRKLYARDTYRMFDELDQLGVVSRVISHYRFDYHINGYNVHLLNV